MKEGNVHKYINSSDRDEKENDPCCFSGSPSLLTTIAKGMSIKKLRRARSAKHNGRDMQKPYNSFIIFLIVFPNISMWFSQTLNMASASTSK